MLGGDIVVAGNKKVMDCPESRLLEARSLLRRRSIDRDAVAKSDSSGQAAALVRKTGK